MTHSHLNPYRSVKILSCHIMKKLAYTFWKPTCPPRCFFWDIMGIRKAQETIFMQPFKVEGEMCITPQCEPTSKLNVFIKSQRGLKMVIHEQHLPSKLCCLHGLKWHLTGAHFNPMVFREGDRNVVKEIKSFFKWNYVPGRENHPEALREPSCLWAWGTFLRCSYHLDVLGAQGPHYHEWRAGHSSQVFDANLLQDIFILCWFPSPKELKLSESPGGGWSWRVPPNWGAERRCIHRRSHAEGTGSVGRRE